MSFFVRVLNWVDSDVRVSALRLRSLSLMVGLLPLLFIGLPAAFLAEPWKVMGVLTGFALCVAWGVFWLWRVVLWVQSQEYREALRRVRENSRV